LIRINARRVGTIWHLYAPPPLAPSNLYAVPPYLLRGAACPHACRALVADHGASAMLDVLYILIGAAFLGGCILYAYACDHL
jgi:hypothetical protein